jgi:hypothetical protein
MLAILRALIRIAYYFTQNPEDRAEVRGWVTKTVEPTAAAIPEYPRVLNPLSILAPVQAASSAPSTAASSAPSPAVSTTEPTCFEELPRRQQSMAKFWAMGGLLIFAGLLVGNGYLLFCGLLLVFIGFLHLRRK